MRLKKTVRKGSAGRKPQDALGEITFSNHTWGGIFRGTKAALIAAGLAESGSFPRSVNHDAHSYWLPLDSPMSRWEHGHRREATLIYDDGQFFDLRVQYNERDLDVAARRDLALKEVADLYLRMTKLVNDIAPRKMSELIAVAPAVPVIPEREDSDA